MKHLMKALAIGSALTALAIPASATPLSTITGYIGFGGDGSYNAGSNQFTAGPVDSTGSNAYVDKIDSTKTDSLSVFTKFSPATFYSFNTDKLGTGANVFTITENGVTLSFELTGFTKDGTDPAGPGFTGTGLLSETGFADTAASFSLNTDSGAATFTTFDTVTAATPEPSSLILLGTGVLGAAGMLRRRFSGKSNA